MFLSLCVSLNFPEKDLVGLAQKRGFLLERALLVVYRDFSLALTHCVTYCDWGHLIPGIVAYIQGTSFEGVSKLSLKRAVQPTGIMHRIFCMLSHHIGGLEALDFYSYTIYH